MEELVMEIWSLAGCQVALKRKGESDQRHSI